MRIQHSQTINYYVFFHNTLNWMATYFTCTGGQHLLRQSEKRGSTRGRVRKEEVGRKKPKNLELCLRGRNRNLGAPQRARPLGPVP